MSCQFIKLFNFKIHLFISNPFCFALHSFCMIVPLHKSHFISFHFISFLLISSRTQKKYTVFIYIDILLYSHSWQLSTVPLRSLQKLVGGFRAIFQNAKTRILIAMFVYPRTHMDHMLNDTILKDSCLQTTYTKPMLNDGWCDPVVTPSHRLSTIVNCPEELMWSGRLAVGAHRVGVGPDNYVIL